MVWYRHFAFTRFPGRRVPPVPFSEASARASGLYLSVNRCDITLISNSDDLSALKQARASVESCGWTVLLMEDK